MRAALNDRLSRIPGLEVRTVEAGEADGETDGTRLFSALNAALADVPPDRVAGAIMVTDGRVHDIPPDAGTLGFTAPVHALITGQADERDRRVALVTAPRFGIVGQPQSVVFRIEDSGVGPRSGAGDGQARRRSHRSAHRAHRRQCARADRDPACRARISSKSKPRRSSAN